MPTQNLRDMLLSRWQKTIQPFQINPIASNNAFNDLIAGYYTPGRYYHTLQHILHILITIDSLQAYIKYLNSVQLAAWFFPPFPLTDKYWGLRDFLRNLWV
jgi:predicted metal-dependent HD superfamily phosphohydrolase